MANVERAAAAAVSTALNVQSATLTTAVTVTSTSFIDLSGMSVSITPSSVTSKVLVWVNITTSANANLIMFNLVRDATNLAQPAANTYSASIIHSTAAVEMDNIGLNHLDSPATTSATTYKIQVRSAGGSVYVNRRSDNATVVATSAITVMEIKQ